VSEATILACNGLGKVFRQGSAQVQVLRSVDLQVHGGESVAVIGASGSGKSTLLYLLAGLDQPSSGEVRLFGDDVAKLSAMALDRLRNAKLGFVYQFHHLLPEFSALENVAMPLLLAGREPAAARARAHELLERIALAERAHHLPAALSGGERQRVAIARALANRPRCLLADEPTGNLDTHSAAQVADCLLELQRHDDAGLVLVTHNRELAARMQRVMELRDGGLIHLSS